MDEPALEQLAKQAWRYALSLVGNEAEADDLLQEAWLSTLRAGGRLDKPYLYRAIRSRWIDAWRRRKDVLSLVDAETLAAPSGAMARLEAASELAPAWATLRPEEREALHLCVVEGHTAAEVAAMVDRPRNTVLSLLHRGRAKLRAALTRADREVLP